MVLTTALTWLDRVYNLTEMASAIGGENHRRLVSLRRTSYDITILSRLDFLSREIHTDRVLLECVMHPPPRAVLIHEDDMLTESHRVVSNTLYMMLILFCLGLEARFEGEQSLSLVNEALGEIPTEAASPLDINWLKVI